MKLRPEHECQYDVVSLGEVMLRLDPVDVPFEKARTAKIWHGGGETNVSEGLAYCFGKKAVDAATLVNRQYSKLQMQILTAISSLENVPKPAVKSK